MNTIFYSRRCQKCMEVLNILRGEGFLGYFKLICVDGRIDKMPKWIKMVPTMLLSNTQRILVGREKIYEWITQMKFIRQQNNNKKYNNNNNNNNQQISRNQQISQNNNNNFNANTNAIMGWMEGEHNNKSDSFAYTNIDEALPQNYYRVGGENDNNNAIYTPPKDRTKMEINEQQKRIKYKNNERNNQDEQYKKLVKQQQLNILNNLRK